MEDLDVEGLFWLEGAPDDKVAGRLKFEASNGAHLDLIGSLSGLEWSDKLGGPFRIHGVAANRLLTLDNCLQTGRTTAFPGPLREQYQVSAVLSGAHFGESDFLRFSAVHVEMQHLQQWVNRTGRSVDITPSISPGTVDRFTVVYEPIAKVLHSVDNGELELSFPFSMTQEFAELTMSQSCSIGIRFSDLKSLRDVLAFCSQMQNLITICVDSPARISGVSLSHSDLVRPRSDGAPIHEPIALYARLQGGDSTSDTDDILHSNMLLTFEDIDGLEGIGRWLVAANRFGPVIGLLVSQWYVPQAYVESRFLNVAIAAEALHRIRTREQESPLRQALTRICVDAGQIADLLVGDTKSWIDEIVKMRAVHVVHRGLSENVDLSRMYFLSESIYMLVVVSLLRECGVGAATLSNIRRHQRFQRLAEQVRGTP